PRLVREAEHPDETAPERPDDTFQLVDQIGPQCLVRPVGPFDHRYLAARAARRSDQRAGVLGKTRASEPWARMEEFRTDAAIEAEHPRHIADVQPKRIADVRHLVDEADLDGEESIAGILGEFRR